MRKSLCLIPLTALVLAACGGNDPNGPGSGGSGSSSGGSSSGGTEELSAFVLNLFASDTNGTALPIDLTTVTLQDTPSVEGAAYDSLFAPSSSSSGS
jgi:predicted component of type VI protein secretion system